MNSFSPMTQAISQGTQQGNAQTGGITPSASQPTGASGQHNILCGALKLIVDQLNNAASMLNRESQYTELANKLYKASFETNKVCETLEKEMQPNGG